MITIRHYIYLRIPINHAEVRPSGIILEDDS